MQTEALRLFILSINDNRVNGDFGPARTPYCIPQHSASEFPAMIGARDGKAPQACDGYRGIAWQTFGEPDRHLREENRARSQCVEPGDPICGDLAGHKTRRGAAAHIPAGLLPKIAIESIHPARWVMIFSSVERLFFISKLLSFRELLNHPW